MNLFAYAAGMIRWPPIHVSLPSLKIQTVFTPACIVIFVSIVFIMNHPPEIEAMIAKYPSLKKPIETGIEVSFKARAHNEDFKKLDCF